MAEKGASAKKEKTAKADDGNTRKNKAAASGFAPVKIKDFTITQKRSGRYQVTNSKGGFVNGEEKVKLLTEAKLLKPVTKKAKPAEEAQ